MQVPGRPTFTTTRLPFVRCFTTSRPLRARLHRNGFPVGGSSPSSVLPPTRDRRQTGDAVSVEGNRTPTRTTSVRPKPSSARGGPARRTAGAAHSSNTDPTATGDWRLVQKQSRAPTPWSKLNYEREEQPTRFVLDDAPDEKSKTGHRLTEQQRPVNDTLTPYTDFIGNRFPTLSTAKNWRYWKERGLNRLRVRKFPIHVDASRRMDPYLRE